jgi:hypothetical protein
MVELPVHQTGRAETHQRYLRVDRARTERSVASIEFREIGESEDKGRVRRGSRVQKKACTGQWAYLDVPRCFYQAG